MDSGDRITIPRHDGSDDAFSPEKPRLRIHRASLSLVLSATSLVIACASAAVALFIFLNAGRHKMLNEADQILIRAEANRVLQEVNANPSSHPQLSAELTKLYKDLRYRPRYDVPLGVYERAAFGLAVEVYAIPLTTIQLQRMQALGEVAKSGGEFLIQFDDLARCVVDPHEDGCPEFRKRLQEERRDRPPPREK